MHDIRPPRPRPNVPSTPTSTPPVKPTMELPPIEEPSPTTTTVHPHLLRRRRRLLVGSVGAICGVLLIIGLGLYYLASLQPVDRTDTSAQKIVIAEGQSFATIAHNLEERSIVKNAFTFEVMARLSGRHNQVKAGTCTLTRSESAEQILDKITSGCHDFKVITFYPGATMHESLSKPTSMDVVDVLLAAGYAQADIDAALAKTYTTTGIDLFADKPTGTDLEGYIYGETYYVAVDATVEDILQTAFDQMASDIESGGYEAKFRSRGLNLYQGITLASIVQRELSCSSGATSCYEDQQKIAQIFYSRLDSSMTLGSDVTFYYAADKLGVAPSTDIDSPYNTRRYGGLPPGPIAAPGKHALDAVANPAATGYLFFLAGDDGVVYYAHTNEEHQANITAHCQVLCSQL